ncbi:hypothetical protein GGF31_001498 [Allomyces arbusculus]|nr:hypothetical protein GGF31_001498 [Allomyces arbusculus]
MSSFFGLATGAPPPQQQQQPAAAARMFAAPHQSPALAPAAGAGGFATMTPHDLLALQQQQQQQQTQQSQQSQQSQPQPYQQPQYHASTPAPATMSSLLSTSLQQQSHGFFTAATTMSSSVPPPSPGLPRPASAASSTASHLAPVKVQEGFFIPSDPTPTASNTFQSMLAPPAAHLQQPFNTSSPMLVDAPTTPTTPHWPTTDSGSVASSGPPTVSSAAASWMSLGRTPGTPRGTTRAEALRIGSVPASAFRHHATQPGVHSPLATSFWDAAGSSVGSTAILGTSAGDDDHLAAALASTAPTGAASASAAAAAAASSLPLKSVQVLHEKRRRRRESHNAVERRRRDNINERIQEMGLLLPETYTGSDASTVKAHKGQILRKAVDYVGDLQRLLAQARERHRELEQALRQLGVEPPEMADLDRQMDTLLTLPSHTVGTLMVAPAVLREQQHQQMQQMQPPTPLRADVVADHQQQMVFANLPHVFPAASTTPEITMTAMVAGPSPNGAAVGAGVVPTDAVDGLEQLLIPPAQQWVTTATTASMSGASASLSPTMVTPSLAPIPQQSQQQQQPVQPVQQQQQQQQQQAHPSPFQQPQYQVQQTPSFPLQQPQQPQQPQQYQFQSQFQAPQQQQQFQPQQQQQPHQQQQPTVVMYAAAPTAPGQPPQYYAIQQHQPAQPHPPPPPHPYYVQAPTYQSYQQIPTQYQAGIAQPMQAYTMQGMPAGTIVMQAPPTAQSAVSAQPGGV